MSDKDLPGWTTALYEVMRRSRAVPRLIVLPQYPGSTLSRCLPLVVVLAMIASALYDLGRAESINFVLAASLTTALCLAISWLMSFKPRSTSSQMTLGVYRWLYMLVAVFVGTLCLFVAEAVLATLLGWDPPVYSLASQLWPGETALYDQARLLQFLILAMLAWVFYALCFRPVLPGERPRRRDTLFAGALATLAVAFAAALMLKFGVEVLIGWMSGLAG